MAWVSATVNLNLKGLQRFKKAVNDQLDQVTNGPLQDAFKLWAVRYRSWSQQRFDIFSKGGGDWAPLAASTIKRRRQGTASNAAKLRQLMGQTAKKAMNSVSKGGTYSILRDTGLLFAALSPVFVGTPGARETLIKYGIRVGYGGPQRHATGDKKSKATIADIASFHNAGYLPRLPQRVIIADPPASLLKVMAEDMTKALNKLAS